MDERARIHRVEEAMRGVDRRNFLPQQERAHAPLDRPLPIGRGQTNSQPSTVARTLTLLRVEPGQHVLDVGAGSGWTTALLGRLVGPGGVVIGVELEPELVSWGRTNVRIYDQAWTSVRQADPACLGWPGTGPYDRILVSAESQDVPKALVEQLCPGGIMVIPVAGTLCSVHRLAAGGVDVAEHGAYRFVPLR